MFKFLKTLIKLGAIALLIAAVAEEFRKPKALRDGFGRVAGLVPYDFRPPTPARVMDRMWNPSDNRLLTETPFGVGWTVNLVKLRPGVAEAADPSWN